MPPLTFEQTEKLVHTALSGPVIERASAMFDIIKAVADPQGDQDRYDCALDALRAIDPFTREYEAWFQGRVATAKPATG